jgi:hypothetical protein
MGPFKDIAARNLNVTTFKDWIFGKSTKVACFISLFLVLSLVFNLFNGMKPIIILKCPNLNLQHRPVMLRLPVFTGKILASRLPQISRQSTKIFFIVYHL